MNRQKKTLINLSKQERIDLAKELRSREESFPGMSEDVYTTFKQEEEDLKELLPEDAFNTIDEVIARLKSEGMKIMLGTHPESGNIFVVPADSSAEDIQQNSLFPRHLKITSDMDERLKRLIKSDKQK